MFLLFSSHVSRVLILIHGIYGKTQNTLIGTNNSQLRLKSATRYNQCGKVGILPKIAAEPVMQIVIAEVEVKCSLSFVWLSNYRFFCHVEEGPVIYVAVLLRVLFRCGLIRSCLSFLLF
jgi:hypothetical protein